MSRLCAVGPGFGFQSLIAVSLIAAEPISEGLGGDARPLAARDGMDMFRLGADRRGPFGAWRQVFEVCDQAVAEHCDIVLMPVFG